MHTLQHEHNLNYIDLSYISQILIAILLIYSIYTHTLSLFHTHARVGARAHAHSLPLKLVIITILKEWKSAFSVIPME